MNVTFPSDRVELELQIRDVVERSGMKQNQVVLEALELFIRSSAMLGAAPRATTETALRAIQDGPAAPNALASLAGGGSASYRIAMRNALMPAAWRNPAAWIAADDTMPSDPALPPLPSRAKVRGGLPAVEPEPI